MPRSLRPSLSRCAAVLLFCCAGLAQAQFVWIGPNGTRVYSDQPPPPGTPAAKILKGPGRAAPPQVLEAGKEAKEEDKAPAPAKPKPPTLAEREADYRKRRQESEDAQRKSQAQAQQAAAQAEYCENLRKHKRLYDSGIRIADVGADGQKRFVSDAERAALAERTASEMKECR
ncbi:DUF4124 domain-containing protein [Massilia litorea]|uniref:DUF4124 domain-containing protein n=1 Tax=Massilia litorea TaxID=2769491 RepID=A0A7L9U0J4_9BURK|nr:DUF4124 domain-containing protein [Massilia litorea]QOL48468.1 DUF4124 domain-containing protein [Massilia litorea]